MNTIPKGEQLITTIIQADEAGVLLSRTTIEHFGMTNAVANALNLAITQGMINSIQALAADKAEMEAK